MVEPGNGILWRISEVERRIGEIERLEPAVMRSAISDVKDDVKEIRKDVTWIKRTFIGFCISFAFSGITMVILLTQSKP